MGKDDRFRYRIVDEFTIQVYLIGAVSSAVGEREGEVYASPFSLKAMALS